MTKTYVLIRIVQKKMESLQFRPMLNSWRKRNLTIFGKVLILKPLGLAKLVYKASIIETPECVMKQVDSIVVDFLLDKRTEKVKRLTLDNEYDHGGIKTPDFRS